MCMCVRSEEQGRKMRFIYLWMLYVPTSNCTPIGRTSCANKKRKKIHKKYPTNDTHTRHESIKITFFQGYKLVLITKHRFKWPYKIWCVGRRKLLRTAISTIVLAIKNGKNIVCVCVYVHVYKLQLQKIIWSDKLNCNKLNIMFYFLISTYWKLSTND